MGTSRFSAGVTVTGMPGAAGWANATDDSIGIAARAATRTKIPTTNDFPETSDCARAPARLCGTGLPVRAEWYKGTPQRYTRSD